MKKIKVFVFMFLFFFLSSFAFEQKYIIGVRGAGFFSEFFVVLMSLIGCKQKGLMPVVYWDRRCPYYVEKGNQYNNAWEYYFKPVSNAHFETGDKINRITYSFPGAPYIEWRMPNYPRNFDYSFRKYMNDVIREYIRIKEHILKKIELFYIKNIKGKKVIGIHIRGTNKIEESSPVNVETFLKTASKYVDNGYKIFIASDEHAIVKKFKKIFPGKIICYDAHRSSNSSPHYVGRDKKDPLNAVIGEEVLIETILLSKCDVFLHSVSNVSTAVLFFNPKLKNIFLNFQAKTLEDNSFNQEKTVGHNCKNIDKNI